MGLLIAAVSLFAAIAAAQQGVLSNGNSQFPACAQSCPLLNQAAQACSATDTASQQAWICFCQSAYLTNLKTSATGVCDSTCTNPSDLQQVSTWYKTNCGSDNGASEHAGDTGAAASSTAAAAATSSTAGAKATSSSKPSTSSGSSSSSTSSTQHGSWWDNHYQWIAMLIVLAILLPALGFFAAWLKRRHDRKQDQIREGFNAGITSRSAGPDNRSGAVAAGALDGSGRNTPTRTRDAYMPYGYAYSNSQSRVGSRQTVGDPPTRGGTPAGDLEKGAQTPAKKKSKKVLVRERSAADSYEGEKE